MLRELDQHEYLLLRDRMRKRILKYGGTSSKADEISKRLERIRNPKKYIPVPKRLLFVKQKKSIIMDSILPSRSSKWMATHKRKENTEIELKDFSFIDNPIGTCHYLTEIVKAESSVLSLRINYGDEYVFDVSPFLVFAIMRHDMAPILSGGMMKLPVMKVIDALELRQFMKIGKFRHLKDHKEVWGFKLRRRRKTGSSEKDNLALSPTTKEKVADELVDTVNEWLAQLQPEQELTNDGIGWLQKIVGEVLDNAERHGSDAGDGDWTTAGFMARRKRDTGDNEYDYICCLSFVNLGKSIGETILDARDTSYERDFKKYLNLHGRSTLGKKLDDELLATVFALQDGVSRKLLVGGVGTMDIVEFANDMSSTESKELEPKVTFISGASCIQFASPYIDGKSTDDAHRRTQWFNKENNPDFPPESRHVFRLPIRFPGTIISIRFTIDQDLLADLEDE